jgi:hypothetical protein
MPAQIAQECRKRPISTTAGIKLNISSTASTTSSGAARRLTIHMRIVRHKSRRVERRQKEPRRHIWALPP